jgi:hypothetical protein
LFSIFSLFLCVLSPSSQSDEIHSAIIIFPSYRRECCICLMGSIFTQYLEAPQILSLYPVAYLAHIVAYRPVVRQRPWEKRVQPLLCSRWINKWSLMSNSSVNTFRAETNTHATTEEWCFWCGPRWGVIKKTTGVIQFRWGLAVELSCAREAEKRWRYSCELLVQWVQLRDICWTVMMWAQKLKNLHC